jgi:hypothetical protein
MIHWKVIFHNVLSVPHLVGAFVANTCFLLVGMAWLEIITGVLQAGSLLGGIIVSLFTVRYLIRKTNAIKNGDGDEQ